MAYKGKSLDVLKKSDPGGFKARIAHLIATGNSAAVPTKYLPAGAGKILQQRNLKARLDSPVTPGSSLTNRDLAHEAASTIQTTYQPQEQAMNAQEGQLVNQRANLPQYYQNYLGVLKGAQTQAGADAARTGANIAALGASAQQAATTQDASVLARMQQDAQSRGATVDPSLAANAANAASSSRSVADAQAGTANLLGLAQQGLLRMTEAGAGLAQQEGIGKLNAQQSQLAQQNTALKREEGLANQAYRTKRRSDEVTSVATSSLAGVNAAAKAAGVEQGAKRVSIAQQNADTAAKRAASAGQPSTVAKPPSNYTGSPADWNALSRSARDAYVKAHPTGKGTSKTNTKDQYGNTPLQRRSAASAYKKALRIGRVIGGNDPSQILLALTQKFPSVDDTILAGAAQEAALGHIGPKTAAHLKRRGVKGRPLAPSSQQTTGGGASTYDKGASPG